ncbi:MAG TPA: hypothetical protein VFT95_17630 [Micromonosporaceae bacterium]|nr:hypothetical protein [Micromonosporaceae bacterium]
MALSNRYKSAPAAGTLAAFLLVLIFGSPWYRDWVTDNTDPETAGGWFLRRLAWPAWTFDSDESLQDIIAADLRAILVVLLAWLFLYMLVGTQLARARGTLSQFFAGWAAYIFAAAFAALIASLFQSNPSLLTALRAIDSGATYGLYTGWIIGAVALGGRRGTR